MNDYQCSYCDYYGWYKVGSLDEIVEHAASHPIGNPFDMAVPV